MARILTAFHQIPKGGEGLARDMRVRWALEEAELTYETRTVDVFAPRSDAFIAEQPFGQIPAYSDGDVHMFETGAIVLRIGEGSEALLPADPAAKARAVSWLFAALNTIEPVTWNLIMLRVLKPAWAEQAQPAAIEGVRRRFRQLCAALGDREWLDGRFTVGDLMMVSVLRHVAATGLVDEYPNLAALNARAEARPAFQRALATHLADLATPKPTYDQTGERQ